MKKKRGHYFLSQKRELVSPLAGRGLFGHCGSGIRVQLACLLHPRESKTSQLLGQRHEVVRVVKNPYRKELSGRISKKRSVTYDIRVKTKPFFGSGFPRNHLHLIDCETIFPSCLECRCAVQLRGTYEVATASRKCENKHLCAENQCYCKLRKVFCFANIFRTIF